MIKKQSSEGVFSMCNEAEVEIDEEIQVLFTEDVEILEDRLNDIILAMGLPEEQTNAVLRLISDSLVEHHFNILDTYEDVLEEQEEEYEEITE